MAFRVDTGSLRSPRRLDDGRIVVDGVLTRSGVFTYRNPDGSERREYRPPEEVFRKDSMESFALVPVTDDHPSELLSAKTARNHTVGTVGESVRRDEDFMVAPLAIHDADTVAKLDAGKTALSCGYVCDIEETEGTSPSGERYDSIQRNIRGNHVAIVEVGRAGPEARIRMDSAVMINGEQRRDVKNMDELKEALKKVAELEVAKAGAEKRADEAEAKCKELQTRCDEFQAKADDAADKAKEAEKARQDAADTFEQRVAARVELQAAVASQLKDYKFAGKSDRDIKAAFVQSVTNFDCEGRSEAYVDARFDAAVERVKENGEIYSGMNRIDAEKLDAGGLCPELAAKQRMEQRTRDAWKGKQ